MASQQHPCSRSREGEAPKQSLNKEKSIKLASHDLFNKATTARSGDHKPNNPIQQRSYMRSTSSSDFMRKGKLHATDSLSRPSSPAKSVSLKPVKPSMKKGSGAVGLHSMVKELREREGSSILQACRYTYCSLHGHEHESPLPSLKCFLPARRQMLKDQKSRKSRHPQDGSEIADIVRKVGGLVIDDNGEADQQQESFSVTSFEDYGDEISELPSEEMDEKEEEEEQSVYNDANVKDFNPHRPRILPLEHGLEAEKVNLKHPDVEERKAAEEWMIDYALRNAIRRMAPARRRRVSLLVAAFESVMPQKIENLLFRGKS